MDAPTVTYQIDRQGRILSVGQGWDRFAHANHGDHLTGTAVIGRTLWEFISDPTTRALYRVMADRLFAGAPEIAFTFRCDAPEERRLLEMRMVPLVDERIEFRVTPQNAVERRPMALLDPTVTRSGDLVRMCSWCKRIPIGAEEWVEVEVAVQRIGWLELTEVPAITHGICPSCEGDVFGLANEPTTDTEHPTTLGAFV